MNKVYILGGAQTDYSRNWSKEGKNVIALLKEVMTDGLKKTGLSYDEISRLNSEGRIGFFMGNFIGELYIDQGHLGSLLTKVHPSFVGIPSARYESACASGSTAIDAAISKVRLDDLDVAIVVGWELMKTVNSDICGDILGRASYYEEEAKGISLPFPKLFGKLADEMILKYNLDEEKYLNDLSKISFKNYSNAKNNKNAQTRTWFMDERQSKLRNTETNPLVGGKLAVSDCSQVTDGAAMVVLSSKRFKMTKENHEDCPVIKGWGHRVAPLNFSDKMKESKNNDFILPWTRQTIVDTYNKAKLSVEDMDFFEVHDCFTSSEYMSISAFGLTPPGEEYKIIDDGSIQLTGNTPINPSGGLIGCGHPVGASGVRMLLDLYKQVTGTAEKYQVKGAKNGIMLNIGGSATTNYSFIVGKE